MLNDYEPSDDQVKNVSDVEMAPNQDDSSDDDFDKMMDQIRIHLNRKKLERLKKRISCKR